MNLLKKRLIKSVSGFLAVLVFALPLSAFAAENNGKINQTPPVVSLDKSTQQNIINNSSTKEDVSNNKKAPQGLKTWVAKASLQALSMALRSAAGISRVSTLVEDNYGDENMVTIIRYNSVLIADTIDSVCYDAGIYLDEFRATIAQVLINQGVESTTAQTAGWVVFQVISWGAF